MNRFRANLHPAFLNKNIDTLHANEALEVNELEKELVDLKKPILEEFKASTDNFLLSVNTNKETKILSRYSDLTQLRSDQKRFFTRTKELYKGKEFSQYWNENITTGFGVLIETLKDNGYFKGKNKKAVESETATIKKKYWEAVKTQYIDEVWFADDNTFNSKKAKLFDRESDDSPANKVYKELTGAAGINDVIRTYTEGYGSDILGEKIDDTDEGESDIDRQNRKFLSNELTKYLWDIRKAPGVVFDVVQGLIPIFNAKVDRPSKEDRKAISSFLKASNKITTNGGKNGAIALLEVFHDNKLNKSSTPEQYLKILEAHNVKLKKEKYLDDIMDAGSFYISTQKTTNEVRDQHAIYLSVLKVIESCGGPNKAAERFKDIVKDAKKDKKDERKQGYEKGETLEKTPEGQKLKELATKLGILDFTNASRLQALDKPDFENKPVEQILANLNNDKTIDARDTMAGGLKSGKQFLETFKQVGKEKALPNLLRHANLLNKSLNLNLDMSSLMDENGKFKNAKEIEEEIKKPNKELIFLLQDIISKPGEELFTLLSGHTENPFEGVDLSKAKEEAKKAAESMLSKEKIEEWKQKGLDLPKPEDLQSGLAATLYTEYSKGIGLGSKVSFDQWIKGVGLNLGLQVRDGKDVVVGIGLDYSKQIKLGNKGWSTTPGLATGGFIPLGTREPTASISAKNEIAKERTTKFGTLQHVGVDMGVTLMPSGVTILSAGLNWHQDKLAGIEAKEQEKKGELQEAMKDVLGKVYEKRKMIKSPFATKLNFNDSTLVNTVKNELQVKAKELGVKEKDMVVNATLRLLTNYNGWDLHQKEVRDLIAEGVAEEYAMSWAEARKAKITDSAYLSGANLGAFWVVGSPLVGVYAGVKVTKHRLDGYGDKWGDQHEISHNGDGKRNSEMISSFNQELGLSGNESIKLNEQGFIEIPSSLKHRVNVNEKMKGLMKKGEQGKILLDSLTPMAADIKRGAATQGSEIIIGGKKLEKGKVFQKLDTLGEDRFTKGNIDKDKISELGETISEYKVDHLNKALNELKQKLPGDSLKDFDFTTYKRTDEILGKLNKLDKTKKAKLTLTNNNGEIDVKDPVSSINGRGLEIEYQANFEMIDSKAKEIAKAVYNQVLSLDANGVRILNSVKHDAGGKKHRDTYDTFNNAILEGNKNGNYENAKTAIKPILEKLIDDCKLDKNDNGFKKALETIKDMNGAALGQALMSIDNIFARSTRVIGKNNEYTFPREGAEGMSKIIADREKQISSTINNRLKNDPKGIAKEAYLALINASKDYRTSESHSADFKKQSTTARQLDNTVGFNLGDKTDPERPLFNPEIYQQMVDLDSSEFQTEKLKNAKNTIHQRAMKAFANNDALINPILKVLGLEGKKPRIREKFEKDGNKGKITLDIGEKNDIKSVTLSAGMKFGYFTQCVNHTVILDDITVESEDGTTVNFNSGVWEKGQYREGSKSSIVSTTEVGASVAVTFSEKQEKEPENKEVASDKDDLGFKGEETDPKKNDKTDEQTGTETQTNDDESIGGSTDDEL